MITAAKISRQARRLDTALEVRYAAIAFVTLLAGAVAFFLHCIDTGTSVKVCSLCPLRATNMPGAQARAFPVHATVQWTPRCARVSMYNFAVDAFTEADVRRDPQQGTETMTTRFTDLASYNRWANARLFAAALALPDEAYRRNVGVYFHSIHGTLNHLLLTDRNWLTRLTGGGTQNGRLDAILYEDRKDLARARIIEDDRLANVVATFGPNELERELSYQTTSGQTYVQRVGDILSHLFNHQTHHRGQVHACFSILGIAEPPMLDLLAFQRGLPAPSLVESLRD